jgi:hypothetical protein
MGQREQKGHLYKAFGGWHVRYWVAYNDLTEEEKGNISARLDRNNRKRELKGGDPLPLPSRVQKSKRLCDGDLSFVIERPPQHRSACMSTP